MTKLIQKDGKVTVTEHHFPILALSIIFFAYVVWSEITNSGYTFSAALFGAMFLWSLISMSDRTEFVFDLKDRALRRRSTKYLRTKIETYAFSEFDLPIKIVDGSVFGFKTIGIVGVTKSGETVEIVSRRFLGHAESERITCHLNTVIDRSLSAASATVLP